MPYLFITTLLLSTCLSVMAGAQEPSIETVETVDDSLVRLPDRMQRRFFGRFRSSDSLKFVPGGALILSFDKDNNELISQSELRTGINEAFDLADKNLSGYLSIFEQKEWASTLKVRDDTLANPVRFDPNLNGSISYEEFAGVILMLAKQYQNEKGTILFESLVQIDEEDIKPEKDKPEKPKPGRRF